MSDERTQHIERLSFAEAEPHQAIEAAIHLGRYLLARPFCAGRKVLDAACGEGYGSFFMSRRWAARDVHGIDVSGEAIARARRCFGGDGITFHEKRVEDLDSTFSEGEFDLAISLETIEHVDDPGLLLRSLRRAVRPGGAIIVSCPNDHWYYRSAGERNPFHVRKFTFDDFCSLASAELGPARRWLFGTPLFGYVNIGSDSARAGTGRMALLEARDGLDALIVPPDEGLHAGNCSYFVGVWGEVVGAEPTEAGVLYPCSMDTTVSAAQQAQMLRAELRDAQALASVRERESLAHAVDVRDLRQTVADLRQTVADQARLVDERDAYIKVLEGRVNEQQGRLAEVRWLVENRAFVRIARDARRVARRLRRR